MVFQVVRDLGTERTLGGSKVHAQTFSQTRCRVVEPQQCPHSIEENRLHPLKDSSSVCGTLKAGKYPRPSPCQPSADDPLPEKAASPPSAATAQSAEHRVHSHRRRACDPRNSG